MRFIRAQVFDGDGLVLVAVEVEATDENEVQIGVPLHDPSSDHLWGEDGPPSFYVDPHQALDLAAALQHAAGRAKNWEGRDDE